MTEPKEPTLKQWKRRALHAEEQVAFLQGVRAMESANEMQQSREIAALRVALAEIHDVINWVREQRI